MMKQYHIAAYPHKTPGLVIAAHLLWFLAVIAQAEGKNVREPAIPISTSSIDEPGHWQPLIFDNIKPTEYSVVESGVIQATTEASASGLIHPVKIDPEDYPIISWQWKISNIYQAGDATTKQGDDFPARLYVAFEFIPEQHSWMERMKHEAAELVYGEELPGMTLNYIWANRLAPGTIVPSPHSAQAMMVAVASGPPEGDSWVFQQRNILADFTAAFGGNPPPITGVGIMSDSDNTGEQARAWFKEIIFLPGNGN